MGTSNGVSTLRSTARLGAVAFIHRFGSTLNAHLHFHCVVIDGVFDAAAAGGVVFHAATGIDANAIAEVQARVRRRLLRVFVRRGLLPGDDAQAMGQWEHGGGFTVDGSVRIEAADRAGRERLLRYCARPPFALDRLRELDPEHLVYDPPKPGPGGSAPQCLTPLELLARLAALVPPPRLHRHRYFGVLAPNAPLRTAVTALAPGATTAPPAPNQEPATESAHRRAARYAWALLLVRIYEVFPLVCPDCGGAMRIIAFITDAPTVRDILDHLGDPRHHPVSRPPAARPIGHARCQSGWLRPPCPAGTGVRVRSTHRLVTPTVHRPPRTTPSRRVPAAAGYAARSRCRLQNTRPRCHRGPAATPERLGSPSLRASQDVLRCSR
jgi:hypothetical protein